MEIPTYFMKKLFIEPDDYCFRDPWGESRCPNLSKDDKCKNIEECYECKARRIEEILNTIKIEGVKNDSN